MQEFLEDQLLHDPLSATDHPMLQCLACPTLHALLAVFAKGKVESAEGIDHVVYLLNEATDPEITVFKNFASKFRAGRLSPEVTHGFFNTAHALIAYLPSELYNATWEHEFHPEAPDFRFFIP
ncbi:hypothetical protein DFH08DRAFT_977757 [Mycena albidolilacea]|uniref:Uncharacterized protein n=1 Tax=Mycena albidolilacea TaxID=1033008 RepID=A0AAD7E888_9AGAR|nr:hypothetical protein DFH08DRAFT_977757 [Mycena albidolilacea]